MNMIKRSFICLVCLLLAVSMSACSGGNERELEMDVEAVYEKLAALPDMPAMIVLDEQQALDFLGLKPEDCTQAVTAIAAMNLQADEIWLVEAKNSAAAAEIEELARARVEQRMQEFENYAPDQYQVLENAAILREGNFVVLLASQSIDELRAAFDEAVGIK